MLQEPWFPKRNNQITPTEDDNRQSSAVLNVIFVAFVFVSHFARLVIMVNCSLDEKRNLQNVAPSHAPSCCLLGLKARASMW